MASTHAVCKRFILGLGLAVLLGLTASAAAQDIADDMVGQRLDMWDTWTAATQAIAREDQDKAVSLLEAVAALDPSDLRLALMADRTGSLKLEQWVDSGEAPESVRQIVDKIKAGRRQRALAEDGLHFAAIGRFEYANANFQALLESTPDPVALLELVRYNPNRQAILVKLIANTEVGPAAKQFLELLNEGEELLRRDNSEIARNVAKLAGSPREAHNAAMRLKNAGEYAVPHLIQALRDSDRRGLHPAVIRMLPNIGLGAVNPLCAALEMDDAVIQQVVIDALAEIGYRQALPYLAAIAADESEPADVRATAQQGLTKLGANTADPARLFVELAANYYENLDSLRADPRLPMANVWSLRDGRLEYVRVPTPVFNDIMAMRCCQKALQADPAQAEAVALWLAANFRREAKLGMSVESDQPSPLADKDATRPADTPRAVYFARAAGPKYNQMVLHRAVKDRDPGVALGAIAALRDTAGEKTLVGRSDLQQPLVMALAFPDRQVRIKAALALGAALPKTPFMGAKDVVPVLAEALTATGTRSALLIDPDADLRNKFQAALGAAGYTSAMGDNLYSALENGKEANMSAYDVILVGTDVEKPGVAETVAELRKQFNTAATPILVIAKAGELGPARDAARVKAGVEIVPSDIVELGDPALIEERLIGLIERAAQALGMKSLDRDLSLTLALAAADVLERIGESNSKVFDFSQASAALISALGSQSESLRIKAAQVLALAPSREGQAAIAEYALNADIGADERAQAFASLAEAARRNGNLMGSGELVQQLIEYTMEQEDLVLRAAASKALGALDLESNKASEIIRTLH